jgi:hypothetical protein
VGVHGWGTKKENLGRKGTKRDKRPGDNRRRRRDLEAPAKEEGKGKQGTHRRPETSQTTLSVILVLDGSEGRERLSDGRRRKR